MTATEELTLFDAPPVVVEVHQVPAATIQERFEAFHEANPWVYTALVRLAREAVRRGSTRVGVKGLFEVLRWHFAGETYGGEFRLDNRFTSRYARLIAEREPDLADVFVTRRLTAS